MLRPIQLRASAEDAALMTPTAIELQEHYRELKMPVVIVAGADDKIVDIGRQSRRLHDEIGQSEFVALPGLGHMIHHSAPDEVIRAIDRASRIDSHLLRDQPLREAAEQRTDADAPPVAALKIPETREAARLRHPGERKPGSASTTRPVGFC